MKIFFCAPYSGKATHQSIYDLIISHLLSKDITVISMEIPSQKSKPIKSSAKSKKYKNNVNFLYSTINEKSSSEYILRAISESDLCIFEASVKSFKIGYEAGLALAQKRPTLCLSDKTDLSGYLNNKLFNSVLYRDDHELLKGIDRFLEKYKGKTLSVRYNLLMTPKQYDMLEKYADYNKKSSSQIIRELIDEHCIVKPN